MSTIARTPFLNQFSIYGTGIVPTLVGGPHGELALLGYYVGLADPQLGCTVHTLIQTYYP